MNRKILFTGGTAGLGRFAVCKLANDGDHVIAACRSQSRGTELTQYFEENFPNAKGEISLVECNLSSLKSIKSFIQSIKQKYQDLDMIVNNAGTWNFDFVETTDGIEEILQVNLIAPTLIAIELRELLQNSSYKKIIFTSSGLHQGNIDFNDLEFRNKKFSGFKSYRQSKLGVILICRYLAEIWKKDNIRVYSQHPGLVKTQLSRNAGWIGKLFFKMMGKSPEKGAKTLLYLINTPESKLQSGEYYDNQKVKSITPESRDMVVAAKLYETILSYIERISVS